MPEIQSITPCLWFDDQAEEAANFYISVFDNSRIVYTSRYGEVGSEIHGREPGSIMTVEFELDGHPFTALNGGPVIEFNEAVSFQVVCETQDQVDYFWERLSEGGDPGAQQCGWLEDRYGVSWQVVPAVVQELLGDPESPQCQGAMSALLEMKKIDIDDLKKAYAASGR